MTLPAASPKRIVILHGSEERDFELRDALAKHLAPRARNVLHVWHEGLIYTGEVLALLQERVTGADAIVVLLTPDLLADPTRLSLAEAARARGIPLVPVLGRACDWQASIFGDTRPLPASHVSVVLHPDPGVVWNDVAAALAAVLGLGPDLALTAATDLAERKKAPFLVPFLRNPKFVGRTDDLAALHDLLRKGGAVGVRPAALTDMGGIGKTQLAVEYAHRYADAHPGGVYWVNAAEPLQRELARLAVDLGLAAGDAPEAERERRLARAFVEHVKERPDALVILDNVDEPLTLRGAQAGVVPEQLGCRLLFTTRRRDLPAGFESIEVRVLLEQAAVELLLSTDARRHVLVEGSDSEHAEAVVICRMLGHLPLAVALGAAYLDQNPEIALAAYRGRLLREGALVTLDDSEVDALELPTRHDAAVSATLHLQWRALEGEARKNRDARMLLQAAAILGEAAQISRARLALLTGLRNRAEDGYPARLGSALRALRDLSLAEELTEQEIRLHPLVREFAEKQIVAREVFAEECAAQLCEALWHMGRLHEEVAQRGIDAVLGDLRIGTRLAGAAERGQLEKLSRPLDREAHALRRWDAVKEPGFFLQQLRNRCLDLGIEEVKERAEATLHAQMWPWLRERFRTSRESDALVRTLEGHTAPVTAVAITPDGRFAVSASDDQTLKVWDLATGQSLRTLQGHTKGVTSVAVTANGRFAVSASNDRTLKVWDLATGQPLRTLQGHTNWVTGVAVTADGRFAISASFDNTLKVWDLATGQPLRTLQGHPNPVTSVAVTADGRFAVSASSDRTLKVWEFATRQPLRTLQGHTSSVIGVAVTANGRFAVSASSDRTLKVWDLGTGQPLRTLEGHTSDVTGVAVTADGCFAVSAFGDQTLKVWDLATGQPLRTLQGHTKGMTSYVNGVAVTADGRFAVSASDDRTLKVWDLATGQPLRTLQGHTKGVTSVAVTANGRFAVSTSLDSTLKVWGLGSGEPVRALQGHTDWVNGVAVTPDGHFAVSASRDGTLRVWDLSSGQPVRALQGHTASVNGVAVTPDGRFAVSASHDSTLKVWDLGTGHPHATLKTHAPLLCCAVTPDDRAILAGDTAGALHILDLLPALPTDRLR